jgi:hypothetical protein
MDATDLDFAALKDVARLKYLLSFEAVATAGNDDDSFVEGTAVRQ